MHLKRQKVPKNWPITRKATKYVVRPNSDINGGLPILIILRNILKIAQNRREVKKAIHQGNILLNKRKVKDEKNVAKLFDVITLVPSKKNYKMILSNKGKFKFEEVKENESNTKIVKIINKKVLNGKKTQLNLSGGKNILSDIKCNTGDSIIINPKENKVQKIIPMQEKSNALVIAGNHAGEKGIINKIIKERRMVELKTDEKIVNALIKHIIIIN